MIMYKKNLYNIGAIWFDEKDVFNEIDIIKHCNSKSKPDSGFFDDLKTIEIDLCSDVNSIFNSFKKNTRYEIKKAVNDKLVYTTINKPNNNDIITFVDYYNRFAIGKKIHEVNYDFLHSLASNSCLLFSSVLNNNRSIVWHAYYVGRNTSRLIYSASHFRDINDSAEKQLIGRANRWCHWNDIIFFKNSGIRTYDLGGWYQGADDEEMVRINKFKESFGGNIVPVYNYTTAITIKGKLIILLKKLFRYI